MYFIVEFYEQGLILTNLTVKHSAWQKERNSKNGCIPSIEVQIFYLIGISLLVNENIPRYAKQRF
jgi:hypothetical protein